MMVIAMSIILLYYIISIILLYCIILLYYVKPRQRKSWNFNFKTPESIGMNEKYMYIIFYHDIFYAQKIHELYFSSYKIIFLHKLS